MLPLLLGAYFLLTVSHWSRHLRNPDLRRFLFFTSLILDSLCLVCLALFVAGCLFGWDMPDRIYGRAFSFGRLDTCSARV